MGLTWGAKIGASAAALGLSLFVIGAADVASADVDAGDGGSAPVSAGPARPGAPRAADRPGRAQRAATSPASRTVPVSRPRPDAVFDRLSRRPAGPSADVLAGALNLARRGLRADVTRPAPVLRATVAVAPPSVTRAVANPVANPVASLAEDLRVWVDTFANLYQWWSGSPLPAPLRRVFFPSTPVAAPMQIELDLAVGSTSGPIPFSAVDADGKRLTYSVPGSGMPGGPGRGTVVVDNTTGTFTYSPTEDYTGTDTFSFIASDDTTPHVHLWDGFLDAAFGVLNTSLDGGHRVTATATVFNNVDIRPDPGTAAYTDITGEFSVLTYNVSGQPGPLYRIPNTVEIGSRINAFDIVNVQQDVAYHPFLVAETAFPDRTPPAVPTWLWPAGLPFSDGLNSFSGYYIEGLNRQAWNTRPDLFYPGGFSYSRQHIPGGSSIDVYNLDASGGDLTNAEIAQLSDFIARNSVGRAVIVAGDFAQLYSDPGQTLTQFAAANGLTDAWVELEYGGFVPADAPQCAYADDCEQPDKIFYRDAAPLDPADPATSPVLLDALGYTNEGRRFLNASGEDLSGQRPQSVSFGYSVDALGPMTVDPATWMADLPALSHLPLTQLPIPGTHDSGSYAVTARSEWALTGKSQFGILTELPGFLQDLIVKPIAAAWGKTQNNDLYGQLSSGIRYLDLRLTNEPDGQVYFEHGLRSALASVGIGDIGAFANEHPKELLVVYVQGINNFTAQTHAEVVAEMKAAFGSRMVPSSIGTSATLADLWAIDKNVIVVYNDAAVVAADPLLWPDATIYRPYVGVQSAPALLDRDEGNLATRPPGTIWGMFGENTFNAVSLATGLLTLGPGSNEQMAASVILLAGYPFAIYSPVQQWIRTNFKPSVNLVTADWYQSYWPAGTTFVRDTIGAVYETLGSRLQPISV